MADEKRYMGRPRHYETPEEFLAAATDYIAKCKASHLTESPEPVTWTGMALHMGFCSRQSIDEYAKYEGFSDCVKKAKAMVEASYEARLATTTPTGAIFALKNMGWSDRQELAHTSPDGSMSPTIDTSKLSDEVIEAILKAKDATDSG